MSEQTEVRQEDLDLLWSIRNLYVGQLNATELEAFRRLCRAGLASIDYNHAGGLLGLGKVSFRQSD